MTNTKTFVREPDVDGVLASDAGKRAHCRRVAAWCDELGRALRLSPEEASALVNAALGHHRHGGLTNPALSRLMGDLGIASNAYTDVADTLSDGILAALEARPAALDSRAAELAGILEAANIIDEQLEFAPFEPESLVNLLDHVAGTSRSPDIVTAAVEQLRQADREDLYNVLPNLPVYPAVAMRLYRLLASSEVNLNTLEAVARADQVVAGKLIKAANSVFYSPWQPIRTVAQAISYVGSEDARRILLASSLQPVFSSPRMRKLWKHALEAAQVAERIAEVTKSVEPAEAFLLGLLHDVGKLAISLMAQPVNDAMERLLAKGCQPTAAEVVLCGFDHAEAGGEVLRYWKFPDELIAAVRDHHQPERSSAPISSVLYLMEYWTDSEEDLPSNARLAAAMKATGTTAEVLDTALANIRGVLNSL